MPATFPVCLAVLWCLVRASSCADAELSVETTIPALQFTGEGHVSNAPRPKGPIAITRVSVSIRAEPYGEARNISGLATASDEQGDTARVEEPIGHLRSEGRGLGRRIVVEHMAFVNSARPDQICDEKKERWAIFEQDLSPIEFPSPFGYVLESHDELELSFVVVRGQNTSVNEDLNVIITYSLEYQELRDDNVHSVQGGKFDEFEEVFPVVLDIMGCEDPSTYRLKGRGDVECKSRSFAWSEPARVVFGFGRLKSVGGLNITLHRQDEVVCDSAATYDERGRYIQRMSRCTDVVELGEDDLLVLEACYQYDHAVDVSSDMIVYTTVKDRGGMPTWVSIVSVVVILLVMLVVVACIALLLAHGKRARGSNEFKLLSRFEDQENIGDELVTMVNSELAQLDDGIYDDSKVDVAVDDDEYHAVGAGHERSFQDGLYDDGDAEGVDDVRHPEGNGDAEKEAVEDVQHAVPPDFVEGDTERVSAVEAVNYDPHDFHISDMEEDPYVISDEEGDLEFAARIDAEYGLTSDA